MDRETSYKTRKVISIGTVSELTGLSERQIRYYEERKLVFLKGQKEEAENILFSMWRRSLT